MASSAATSQALKSFCAKIYGELLESQGGNYDNAFMSPISIYAAMAMVMAGSAGSTKKEMLSALQLHTGADDNDLHRSIGSVLSECFQTTPGVTVSIGNRLFAQQSAHIQESYKDCLSKMYKAACENVDFARNTEAARQRINQWVSEQTRDKIKELFPPGVLKPSTCVAITNAVYFKGAWEHAFDKRSTYDGSFFLLNGQQKKMPMMYHDRRFKTADLQDLEAIAVKLPFLKSKWEMLLVVPRQNDGLKKLLPQLKKPDTLGRVLEGQFYDEECTLVLPRFKLSETAALDVKQLLMRLGMDKVFGHQAELQGICQSEPLFVSDVKHKAILEVDEEGATAAAATGIAVAMCCMPMKLEIRVDHPFFVALVYDNTTPVFLGHVTDPEAN